MEEEEAGLAEVLVAAHATSNEPNPSPTSKPKKKKKKAGTGRRVGPHARQLHSSTLCRLLGTVKTLHVTISCSPMRNLLT